MAQSLLDKASSCGCVCKRQLSGNWKIIPSQKTARWELQQVEDRWLLVAGGVAQVNLHPTEAEAFLKRRCSNHSYRWKSEFRVIVPFTLNNSLIRQRQAWFV